MGVVLRMGCFVGCRVWWGRVALVRGRGQVDFVISVSCVVFVGITVALMLIESRRSRQRSRKPCAVRGKLHEHNWLHGLPFKMRFRKSKLYISAIMPFLVGAFVGVLSAIMGVGGGFVMVPAMIYLLGMPTSVVIGTSLFQIIFVSANATFFQAYLNQTVDVVLAMLLLPGAVIGAQTGSKIGAKLNGEQLRVLLGAMVLLVCLKLAYDLVIPPDDVYSITVQQEVIE